MKAPSRPHAPLATPQHAGNHYHIKKHIKKSISCGFMTQIISIYDFFVGLYPLPLEFSFFYGITGRS
jgi:hypothetical protein